MGLLLAGVYLLLVGLTSLFSLAIPAWLVGLVALVAGVLIVLDYARVYPRR